METLDTPCGPSRLGITLIILGVITLFVALISGKLLSEKYNIKIVLDGEGQIISTKNIFVKDIVNNIIKDKSKKDFVVNYHDYAIVNNYMVIRINTKKNVVIVVNNVEKQVATLATTVKELIENIGYNQINDTSYHALKDVSDEDLLIYNNRIELVHYETKLIEELVESPIQITYKDNNNLYVGINNVIDEGLAKKTNRVYKVVFNNGIEVSREFHSETVIEEGKPKIIEKGTKEKVIAVANKYSATASDSVWDLLAQCESSGNWSINTGNGYYGGLQFTAGTWTSNARAVGVTASRADLASKEDQIRVASYLQSQRGWSPWPACSRKLGLI